MWFMVGWKLQTRGTGCLSVDLLDFWSSWCLVVCVLLEICFLVVILGNPLRMHLSSNSLRYFCYMRSPRNFAMKLEMVTEEYDRRLNQKRKISVTNIISKI